MKIEAGCKAIIINHFSASGEVVVGECVGKGVIGPNGKLFVGGDRWIVDKKIAYRGSRFKKFIGYVDHIEESNLMRIDGFKDQDQVSDGKELINVD